MLFHLVFLLLYFLFSCRFTAREEMAERMAAFQPKKNEVHISPCRCDNCLICVSRGVRLALSTNLARNLRSVERASPGASASMTSEDNEQKWQTFIVFRDRLRTKQDKTAEAKVAEVKVSYKTNQ